MAMKSITKLLRNTMGFYLSIEPLKGPASGAFQGFCINGSLPLSRDHDSLREIIATRKSFDANH
jgi:hypothetical protein